MNVYSQDTTKTKKVLDCYIAASLSTSSGSNFNQSTFPSVELGISKKMMTIGFIIGRSNLEKTTIEKLENYWYEIKTTASMPIGPIKGFILAGWGQYYNSNQNFIEYGAGFSYSIKKFDLNMQVSSWYNTVYISPGITYNFKLKKVKKSV